MIMNDLDLHRERELANLRMRMANSVTQFTRGLASREIAKDEKPLQLEDSGFPATRARHRKRRSEVWIKRERSADRGSDNQEDGVMKFTELEKGEKDERNAGLSQLDDEDDYTETDSTISSAVDEVDLKAMYSYACRLMRETLDVEGVCFIDIDGIDWKQALSSVDGTTANCYGWRGLARAAVNSCSRGFWV